MTRRIGLALCLLSGLPVAAAAAPPIAEVICAPRAQLEARLSREFRASLAGFGLRDEDAVMEVWADPRGRWTLVQRYANGLSCILAMGEDWTAVAPDS